MIIPELQKLIELGKLSEEEQKKIFETSRKVLGGLI